MMTVSPIGVTSEKKTKATKKPKRSTEKTGRSEYSCVI